MMCAPMSVHCTIMLLTHRWLSDSASTATCSRCVCLCSLAAVPSGHLRALESGCIPVHPCSWLNKASVVFVLGSLQGLCSVLLYGKRLPYRSQYAISPTTLKSCDPWMSDHSCPAMAVTSHANNGPCTAAFQCSLLRTALQFFLFLL